MGVTPPLRYIHIDDYGPVGIDNGPDDTAFALARADLAATGYRMLVIGPRQYWLQNGFCLNSYTDANLVQYPALPNTLITSDSALGSLTTIEAPSPYPVFSGLPATLILSPGYADPSVKGGESAYSQGSEPCRTTGSIQLTDSCSITNLRIISLAAYQASRAIAQGIDSASLINSLVWGAQASMAAPVGAANGVTGVSAGGGTAVQFDGSYCKADNLVILGFRNGVVSVPLFNSSSGSGASPIFGAIHGDTPNLVRADLCNDSATFSGPIRQENVLTSELKYSLGTTVAEDDGFGGTNILWASPDFGPLAVVPAVGDEITITAVAAATGGPLYNAANISELNPAGNITNRFTGVVTGSGSSGTLNLAGMPISSFFDASSAAGATAVGTISGTTFTITSVQSGVPAVGQWLTSSQASITTPTSIISVTPITTAGTVVCTLSSSLTVSSGTTFTLLPGVTATASITGSTLVASNVSGGTLATGQLITGAGVSPGTTITGSVSANTFSVNTPVLTSPSIFTAFAGAAFTGSISGTTLTVLGTSPPTLSAGNLLLGSGISAGTTIVSPLPAPHYSISSSYTAISAEEMTTSAGEILVGSITGTVATFTSGSGISGQVLTSSNVQLLPNTYLTTSGASGTVGVYQTVGSPPLPNGNPAESVGITAVSTAGTNAAVFGGYITSGTGSSTLSIVTFAAGTTLTTGQTLLGEGIPPSTTVTNSSGIYLIQGSLTAGSASAPLTMIAVTETTFEASISGTVLTVNSVASPALTLSAGPMLSASSLLPGTYISSMTSSGTLAPGCYSVAVPQATPQSSTQTLAVVPYVTFEGSISGTTLTISPYGTFAVGQEVLFATGTGGSTSTTIVAVTSVGTSSTCTYSISNYYSAGVAPTTMTAIPGASVYGAIVSGTVNNASNQFTLSTVAYGTLAIGQLVTGPGLPSSTYITAIPPSGSNIYTLSGAATSSMTGTYNALPAESAVFTASITSSTLLTVSSVASGVLDIGQQLISSEVPTSAVAYLAASSASNVYTLSTPCSNTTSQVMATIAPSAVSGAIFNGTIGGSVAPGTNLVVTSVASGAIMPGQQITGPGISAPTYIVAAPTSGPIGTYTLSSPWSVGATETFVASPPASALFQGAFNNSNMLTVTSLTSASGVTTGSIAPGQALVANNVVRGTTIVSFVPSTSGSVSGGVGTYMLSTAQTASVSGEMAAFAAPSVFTGTITGSTLVSSGIPALPSGSTLTASGLLATVNKGIMPGTGLLQYKVETADKYFQSVGSQTSPETFGCTNSSSSTVGSGSIFGTTMTFVTSSSSGATLAPGQLVVGSDVLAGTEVVVGASNTGPGTLTCAVTVPQQVSPTSISALSGALLFEGSIAGTQLLVSSSVSAQLSTGSPMILLGPGVAFGSIIPGSGALSVEVPQYIGASTFTALTAGLVSGSISGSATSGTATTVLNVAALSAGTVTSPQVLSGANVPFGTTITSGSIAAGATGVVGISTAQTVTNQTILALNPIPQSTAQHTGFLNVYFSALGVRPGRTIDLYQSNQLVIHDVASQSSETIVKTSISGDLRILTLNGTWNQTDLNSTALDIEGSIDQILVNSASVTGAFTFINDMSSTSATRVNSALRVVGSTVALPPGSIIVNHQGLNLLSSGSSYSGGTFIIGQNSRAAAFSSVEFIAGGSPITAAPATFLAPVSFSYAAGAPFAIFDPSCVNVPVDTPNPWGTPGTVISGEYSAAIGGLSGRDKGRIGYVVLPSAAVFAVPGDRQLGKTSLGGIGKGSSPWSVVMTSDGLGQTNGNNSLPVLPNQSLFGSGRVLAFLEATSDWAIWEGVEFLLIAGAGPSTLTMPYCTASSPTAPNPSSSGAASWTIQLTPNSGLNCVNVTGLGSAASIHWLYEVDCIEIQ